MGDQGAEPSPTLLPFISCPTENIFGSGTHGLRRKRPVPSKRESVATSFPALEEADPEEKEAFFAFVQQLGAGHLPPE